MLVLGLLRLLRESLAFLLRCFTDSHASKGPPKLGIRSGIAAATTQRAEARNGATKVLNLSPKPLNPKP